LPNDFTQKPFKNISQWAFIVDIKLVPRLYEMNLKELNKTIE